MFGREEREKNAERDIPGDFFVQITITKLRNQEPMKG